MFASSAALKPLEMINPIPAIANAISTIRSAIRSTAILKFRFCINSSLYLRNKPHSRIARKGRNKKTCSFVSVMTECAHGMGPLLIMGFTAAPYSVR